ncbi:hypothetical protein GOB57_24350 [Sinorhizobium meliloti]|nr:hypothetical protein [Sinorhizobium meliloti]
MAFELAELRDYFVDGHADQGAQREPDGCERSRPHRAERIDIPQPPQDLESSIPVYVEARKRLQDALNEIERLFNLPFQQLLEAGQAREAIEVLNAMPDTHLKSVAISHLLESKKWDHEKNPIWKVGLSPYTREQAGALVQWQRAKKAERAAGEIHGKFAMEKAQEILDDEGNEAVVAFAETLPSSITKAFVMDLAFHRKRREPEAGTSAPIPGR